MAVSTVRDRGREAAGVAKKILFLPEDPLITHQQDIGEGDGDSNGGDARAESESSRARGIRWTQERCISLSS